jgi:hypothetical protein
LKAVKKYLVRAQPEHWEVEDVLTIVSAHEEIATSATMQRSSENAGFSYERSN